MFREKSITRRSDSLYEDASAKARDNPGRHPLKPSPTPGKCLGNRGSFILRLEILRRMAFS